jgi:hypothetical protein
MVDWLDWPTTTIRCPQCGARFRALVDAAGLLRLAWENLRVRWRDWRTWEPPQYVDLRRVRRTWERGGDV